MLINIWKGLGTPITIEIEGFSVASLEFYFYFPYIYPSEEFEILVKVKLTNLLCSCVIKKKSVFPPLYLAF